MIRVAAVCLEGRVGRVGWAGARKLVRLKVSTGNDRARTCLLFCFF